MKTLKTMGKILYAIASIIAGALGAYIWTIGCFVFICRIWGNKKEF